LKGELTPEKLQAEIDRCLVQVNNQMSTWQSDSELSRFNRFEKDEWFPVSNETAQVVQTAREISEQTGGAFDVTVGPLVNLWSFGPDKSEHKLPSEATIAKTKSRVGYSLVDVRLSPPALRKSQPDVYVDLSAIAKGFGVDQVAKVLDTHDFSTYMVEIGGEVRTKGSKPNVESWRVGIETPTPFSRGIQNTLKLSGQSLATSGDYRNFVVIEGKTYSHTIDPRTGWPVDHGVASASVLAESCMLADAYATSLMVLGPEEGYNWAKEHNIAALLIIRDGDTFIEKPTPAFEKLFPTKAEPTMTTTWLIAAGVFLLAVALMSVGVIFSNRRITGSCGGLAGLKDDSGRTLCDACTNPAPECRGPEETADQEDEPQETSPHH
ncbi:MAG: FAD:protein FMN transferase, partial [Planctomycetaceae bacterium]|nr:FAD:protein FMN transferase [Planctomycetaceae bacterium]